MKISELPTDRGMDVLVEITPYVKKLASCKSLLDVYGKLAKTPEEERNSDGFAAKTLSALIPVWMKECRAELLNIIRIVDGVTEEDIQKLGAIKAFERIGELFGDSDFMSFFVSFVEKNPMK